MNLIVVVFRLMVCIRMGLGFNNVEFDFIFEGVFLLNLFLFFLVYVSIFVMLMLMELFLVIEFIIFM